MLPRSARQRQRRRVMERYGLRPRPRDQNRESSGDRCSPGPSLPTVAGLTPATDVDVSARQKRGCHVDVIHLVHASLTEATGVSHSPAPARQKHYCHAVIQIPTRIDASALQI